MHHFSSNVANVMQYSFLKKNEIQHLIAILNVNFTWKHSSEYESSLLPSSAKGDVINS